VDAADREAHRLQGRDLHVDALMQPGAIEHGRHGIDVVRGAVDPVEAGGRVHPGIGRHHEDAGSKTGDADDKPRRPVDPGMHAVPAVEEQADGDRFEEESRALPGEGHADDRPGVLHETRPEQSQFE
jgi:hypothetical protein